MTTLSAIAVERALAKRFGPPSYAFLPQVRNGTGFSRAPRTADALAMGLWPSRGLHLHGFEIKIARHDWLREMRAPEKAESIARWCDFWWLVVGNAEIVQDGELPENWGLIVYADGKTRVAKQAAILEAKPIDRLLLASLLKNAVAGSPESLAIKAAVDDARVEWEREAKAEQPYEERRLARQVESLRAQISDLNRVISHFEIASGVNVRHEWDRDNIGAVVRMIVDSNAAALVESLAKTITSHERAVALLRKAAEELANTRLRSEASAG